jgi:hypothetical protein
VPLTPCYPSQKLKLRTQFTAYAGTDGWVKVVVKGSAANDGNTALYSGTGSSPTGHLTKTINSGDSNANNTSPYTLTDFTGQNGLDSRCVSIGLYWKYAGTVLNRGGTFYTIVNRELHEDLDALPASTISTMSGSEVGAVDGAEHHVVWSPGDPTAWDSAAYATQNANQSTEDDTGQIKIGLLVAGNSGTAIQCMVVELWEVAGIPSRHSHTVQAPASGALALHGHLAQKSLPLKKDALLAAATGAVAMCAESPAVKAIAMRAGGAIEAAGRKFIANALPALGSAADDLPMIGL